MFNPTESKVKWYKRKSGTYAKQINLNVDCQFHDGESVYVISQDEFNKYFNPEMHDENLQLKEQLESMTNDNFQLNSENNSLKNQLRNLQNDFDAFKMDSESMKQQIESDHERILNEIRPNLEDAEKKAEKLQDDINQMHQDHADEVKELNQKLQDSNDKLFNVQLEMNDVQRFNAMLVQDANRKNLELRDYQDEIHASIQKAVKETEKTAMAKIQDVGIIKFALHKKDIDLNIPIDDIIADNTPARRQGFFEVITAPQITNGDGDVGNNTKEDKAK